MASFFIDDDEGGDEGTTPGSGCSSVSNGGNCRCGSSASEEGSPVNADVIHVATAAAGLQVEVVV